MNLGEKLYYSLWKQLRCFIACIPFITVFSCSNMLVKYSEAEKAAASVSSSMSTLSMVAVNGGTFSNGTANMTVSSFYIGKYEVTQKQYATVMGSIPSPCSSIYGLGTSYPVYFVTWYDAVSFCNALSEKEGYDDVYTIDYTVGSDTNNTSNSDNYKYLVTADFTKNGYRLPTEAEWQFAAMGGNSSNGYTYSGSNMIGNVAWYYDNSGSSAHTVGGKASNELGLYDMSGNVWEWCWDWYGNYPDTAQTDYTGPSSGACRIIRGDSWVTSGCAVSARSSNPPSYYIYRDFGFRVVRSAK